jgi:prophage regulatory protein
MQTAQTPTAARRTNAQPLEVLNTPDALLRIQTVVALTGISSVSVYRKVASGDFPAPVKLGTRCTRWRAADVRGWLRAKGGAQ